MICAITDALGSVLSTQESNAAIKDYESRGGDFAALCRELNAPPAPIMLDETDEEGDGEVSLFYPKP